MEPTRLFDLPRFQLDQYPQEVCIATGRGDTLRVHSTQELINDAERFSIGLIRQGITPGDKVAISSGNRSEWCIADMAILQIGAIVVPIYPTCSDDDFDYVLEHSESKICFTGDATIGSKAASVLKNSGRSVKHYSFDPLDGAENWRSLLVDPTQEERNKLRAYMDAVQGSDLATLIYTSGTTGRPKGVMLTHSNLLSNVLCSEERLPVDDSAVSISFLPLSHVYERMLMYLYIRTGVSIHFKEDLDEIGEAIREIRPSVFTAVPRLLEKIFDKIMFKGSELTGIKRKLFFWAVGLGLEYDVHGKGFFYKMQLALANKLIFSKWREALGDRVQAIASGSAALQPRLARIFNAARIPVLEGYGLTETSPVVSVNEIKNDGMRFGTVGRILKDVQVKIAEDGEILVKGPNVMIGYYKEEAMTREVLEPDGWLHTGDIGELDKEGFLRITDRKKQMFKTSGGKYIAPQVIENKFKESQFIEQVMVVGENRKFPSALIVPNFEYLKAFCKEKGIAFTDRAAMAEHVEVRKQIQKEVDACNAGLGHWEQIKRFVILPNEWTIEAKEITPTLKLRRKEILEHSKEHLDRIYGGD